MIKIERRKTACQFYLHRINIKHFLPMKTQTILLLLIMVSVLNGFALSEQKNNQVHIIPEPVSVKPGNGKFTLPKKITITAPQMVELQATCNILQQKLSVAMGATVTFTNKKTATIQLLLNKYHNGEIGEEGYTLHVTSKGIKIAANTTAGIFYGVQTLLQLLPPEIECTAPVKEVNWEVPIVQITDYPKVGWRGLMFDCVRHFFTADEVKQFIDDMAQYKYNLLHWHLTDNEGWRIEIKSLPKLTEIGAWRIDRVGSFGKFAPAKPNEPKNYGGYYTQEQIKEIVDYAAERFVQIMPEIDVPGHSMAAVASYPELSCTPEAVNYEVRFGEPLMDGSQGGYRPIVIKDNTLCPANEYVYHFLNQVFTEVAALFPFEYIHTGGDEAPFNFWEKNKQISRLMQRENLKKMEEVQAYFTRRVEKIIQSKGKKMMAWEEAYEGGIENSTAIMNWLQPHFGVAAANNKHFVVNTLTRYAYLDFMQADVVTETPVYATLRLNKSYKFEPVAEGVNPHYVLGGQANLWTEQIYNFRQVQYMVWPRAFAIAESLWTPTENKNWNKFVTKTENHFKRFEYAQKKYSPAMYDPIVEVSANKDNRLIVKLTPEISGLDIYTSFDFSTPDNFYPKYTNPLIVPIDAQMLRIVTYKDGAKIGRVMTIMVEELEKRIK